MADDIVEYIAIIFSFIMVVIIGLFIACLILLQTAIPFAIIYAIYLVAMKLIEVFTL